MSFFSLGPLQTSKKTSVDRFNSTSPDIDYSIYLLGDAGSMKFNSRNLLKRVLESQKVEKLVVFLGDNIYPDGLRPESHPERNEDLKKLYSQLSTVKSTGARALFVPGNHDWGSYRADGHSKSSASSLIDQQNEVVNFLSDPNSFQPKLACPGPSTLRFGNQNLITIDSQWLLFDKQESGSWFGECPDGNDAVIEKIASELNSSESKGFDLFISHHPLVSYGRHSRESGFSCVQGMNCRRNLMLRNSIERQLKGQRPLVCAAGHDHSLQVIMGDEKSACQYYIVSGAMSNTTRVYAGEGLLYGRSRLGFMRLDFFTEESKINAIWLRVYTVVSDVTPDFELQIYEAQN